MLFINTRPIERAQLLTTCLREAGFDVVDLPLLALKARPFSHQLQSLYSQLQYAQMVVVVSPTAVDIGMQYLQQAGISLAQIQHLQWIAVGKKTAQKLAEFGVRSHIPEVETSEGMLGLPIFKQLKNITQIAFWRGEGGRQFMMQHFENCHIDVLNFVLYERSCPKSSLEQFPSFVAKLGQYDTPYWNCISSEASWNHWLALTQRHDSLVNACHYLVLGERLYQLLVNHKKKTDKCFKISKILNLEPETILHTMLQLQRKL